jgi:hypothetical protein
LFTKLLPKAVFQDHVPHLANLVGLGMTAIPLQVDLLLDAGLPE